tara:strand:+ start:3139 stop:3477 length:339 start_codon:yes stop_codon:yes gene_type:complete
MLGYIYSLVATILIGLQIVALKLMTYDVYFYPLAIFVVLSVLLSRYYIYEAMKLIDNPTVVHLLINMSVFITFICSVLFFNLKKFDYTMFIGGMIFIIFGIYLIESSYRIKR